MTTPRPSPASTTDGRLFKLGTGAVASIVLVLVAGILVILVDHSRLSIAKFGLSFWKGRVWDPVSGEFGALPFLWGTLYSSLLALVISTPIALGIAVFLAEISPRVLRAPLAYVTDLLAAIPSIVYGLWGIFVMVPFVRKIETWTPDWLKSVPLFSGPPVGVGMLSAGLILAVMVTPFTASVTREILKSVPITQREGAYALGATRWEAIQMALSYGRAGIIGGIMLGLGRALGETMAVTMVIGNNPQVSTSLFAPQYTMASVLANEFTEAADDLYLNALIEIGLVLFVVTVVVNTISRLLILWSTGQIKWGRRVAPAAALQAAAEAPMISYDSRRRLLSNAVVAFCALAVIAALIPLGFILFFVLSQGHSPALDVAFFTQMPKPVGEVGGGMANAMMGTLMLLGMAALLGVPVGIIAAVYLSEYRRSRLGMAVRFAADVLNGVPSIVVGIFAYSVAVLPFKHFSALAGGVALGVMMIPIVVRTAEELLLLVPGSLREGALALGATRARAVWGVILPAALPGIVTGVLVAMARIAGETAPLLFTSFNNRFWSTAIDQPIGSLTVQIYTYAIAPYADWHRQAWAGATVLIGAVLVFSLLARMVTRRLERMHRG